MKTTTAGYTPGGHLKLTVSARDMRRLGAFGVPSYVVGIDERSERGFVMPSNGTASAGFSRMRTDYPLTSATLEALHREVEAFWRLAPTFESSLTVANSKGEPG